MKVKNYQATILVSLLVCTMSFAFVNEDSKSETTNQQETKPTIIELLENGESYSIEITSVGCFNGTRQTLVVSKNEGILIADFQNKSKILNEGDIEAFVTFELQLRSLQIGGCTTVDTYVLRYGSEVFRTSDGTCSWFGGKKLIETIS